LGYISEYRHLLKKLNLDSRYLSATKKIANHNIFCSKTDQLKYGIYLEGYDYNLEMDFNNLVKENSPKEQSEVIAYLKKQQEDFYLRQVALGYVTNGQMLQYYTANLTSFNWINVDKFIGVPQDQFVEYKLDMDNDLKIKDKKMFAIIPETNSTIPIYNNKVKLPSKYKANIVAYYMDKDMKVHYCKREVNKDKDTYSLDFKEKTLEEFKNILAAL
jgi:hypothetical protein